MQFLKTAVFAEKGSRCASEDLLHHGGNLCHQILRLRHDADLVGKAMAKTAIDDCPDGDTGLDGVTGVCKILKGEKIMFPKRKQRRRDLVKIVQNG